MSQLQDNIVNLQEILNKVNNLPDVYGNTKEIIIDFTNDMERVVEIFYYDESRRPQYIYAIDADGDILTIQALGGYCAISGSHQEIEYDEKDFLVFSGPYGDYQFIKITDNDSVICPYSDGTQ